jgi:quercetin dioxygenase-like cupin family protein
VGEHTDFDRSAFTNTPFLVRVEKPWGYELIFTPPDKPYTGKILHIDAGKRISLQYHDQKAETIMLLRGRGILLADNAQGELEEIEMEPLKGYSNVPGQRHRLIAVEDCDFFEASLPEIGTTFRLEDDSGRGAETEESRSRERGAT